jgi:hypothetical protein
MDLEEAKRVIHCELDAPLGRLFWATSVVTAPENDGHASLLDLVNCLRRGDTFRRRTEMHELAALALYRRTGRKRAVLTYQDFITDADNWLVYLKKHGLV